MYKSLLAASLILVGATVVRAQAPKVDPKDPDAVVNAAAKDDKGAGAIQRGGKLPGDLSDLLDADGDGRVSDAEAAKAVAGFQKAAGAKTDEGMAVRNALDKNGDGKVDPNEAAAGVARGRMEFGGAGKEVAGLFGRFDVDGNETITTGEFRDSIEKLGVFGKFMAPKMAQMFNQMDTNRDGQISMVEAQMMADYFSQQAAQKEQQREEQRNAGLWQSAQQALAAQDKNRDQRITEREASPELKEKFATVDADLNGKVTVAELYEYLKANAPAAEKPREGRPGFGPGGPGGPGGKFKPRERD
jgi:Ca2+-binding EF-hand superfamily protein